MLDRKKIDKCFVCQHDMTDCGAACLLSLIKYFGGDSSILHLREISGTSNAGTTLLGLYQAAQTMGFDAQGAEANGIKSQLRYLGIEIPSEYLEPRSNWSKRFIAWLKEVQMNTTSGRRTLDL